GGAAHADDEDPGRRARRRGDGGAVLDRLLHHLGVRADEAEHVARVHLLHALLADVEHPVRRRAAFLKSRGSSGRRWPGASRWASTTRTTRAASSRRIAARWSAPRPSRSRSTRASRRSASPLTTSPRTAGARPRTAAAAR